MLRAARLLQVYHKRCSKVLRRIDVVDVEACEVTKCDHFLCNYGDVPHVVRHDHIDLIGKERGSSRTIAVNIKLLQGQRVDPFRRRDCVNEDVCSACLLRESHRQWIVIDLAQIYNYSVAHLSWKLVHNLFYVERL